MPRIEKRLPIINKLGLHARAAIKLVQLTASYQATIMVSNEEKEASADSVMGLLMLEAAQGSVFMSPAKVRMPRRSWMPSNNWSRHDSKKQNKIRSSKHEKRRFHNRRFLCS